VETYLGELEERLAAAERTKADLVAAAPLPVEGLAIGEDGLTFRGMPFSQASSAEQIRTSTAVAIALNPELRCLRISEGSLLDSGTRKAIDDLARERGYLVLVECVTDEPTGGPREIFIEDGTVASAPTPLASAAEVDHVAADLFS
jgi:hypothetical protein